MTTAQVVETSVSVNNSPIPSIQDYDHPDDQPTYEMSPGFKPFKKLIDEQILPNLEVACVQPPPPLWKKSEKRLLLRFFLKGSGGGGCTQASFEVNLSFELFTADRVTNFSEKSCEKHQFTELKTKHGFISVNGVST